MSVGSAKRPSRPSPVTRAARSYGDLGAFSWTALTRSPSASRYLAEAMRQTRILLSGTTGLVAFLSLLLGAEAALFGSYFLRSVGAESYIGLITALADSQVIVPLIFGYAFAAKVGCGLVAEIGAMRIADEIDALEAGAIDPMRFIVGTRLLATAAFLVIVYPVCAACANVGSYLMAVPDLHAASPGEFNSTHWVLQNPINYLYSFLIFAAVGLSITLVATWFGYRVRGGPAEVGTATSKAMIVNLVLVHVLVGTGTAFFYGAHPQLSIGGL